MASNGKHLKKIIILICSIFVLCFIALIAYSGYQLWRLNIRYADEAQVHRLLLPYKPLDAGHLNGESTSGTAPGKGPSTGYGQDAGYGPDAGYRSDVLAENQSILELQAQYPDSVGWLTILNTKIDYPFVQYEDNDYYLYRDISGTYAAAGTIFMDYRCTNDFTSQNTILYGHHMKNKSVFGSLDAFNDSRFFDENRTGVIYLANETLSLEFFASMVVEPSDYRIYGLMVDDDYFSHIKQNARCYREIGLTASDRIVTLSTCSYEFHDARMVLLARVSSL